MGRRKKSSRKPISIVPRRSPKTFDCPYCDSDKAIGVRMMRGQGVAELSCKQCPKVFYQMSITSSTAEIDVFAQWFQCITRPEY